MASTTRSPYQPVSTGGVLGFVQRMFVATPAYRGAGQPAPAGGGLLGGLFCATPAYKAAPPEPAPSADPAQAEEPATASECDDHRLTIVIANE